MLEVTSMSSEVVKISKDAVYATGKRKDAVARVWMLKGSGKIFVNGKVYSQYFKRPIHQLAIEKPLTITKSKDVFDIVCTVKGGGLSGQAGAVTHGISKALVSTSPDSRKIIICPQKRWHHPLELLPP